MIEKKMIRGQRQLLLIRHCQSSGQEPHAPLTERGKKQAESLTRFLSDYPIDMIVSSPYARARQSIEPFAAKMGLRVHLDYRLVERTLSARPIENWREVVRDSFEDFDLRVPGGESAREVFVRGQAAIADLLNGGHEFPLAVTHGKLLSLILNALDPNFGYDAWESLSNPDVFRLRADVDRALGYERLWSD